MFDFKSSNPFRPIIMRLFPRHLGAVLPSVATKRMTIGRLMLVQAVASAAVLQSTAKSPGTFAGGWRPQPSGKQCCGRGCDLGTDLDELLFQARQRPILDRLWRRQCAQEVAEVVSERMKLQTHRVGSERSA